MQISPAELEVMKALWAKAPRVAQDIADEVTPETGWSDRTVKTLLSRLVEKGAISAEPQGRKYLYAPLLDQSDYRKREAGNFVDKLFGGRAAPLVAHLAESRDLSDDDIAELEGLIEALKNDR